MNQFPGQPFNPFPGQAPPPGQQQQPAPAAAPPGYGVPPGAYGVPAPAQQPPPGFAPPFQPAHNFGQVPTPGFGQAPAGFGQPVPGQSFGVPQAPPGFAPQGQAVPFQAQDPSLDDRESSCPEGVTDFECTGEVELGGQGRNLLVVKLKVLQSTNPSAPPGTPFAFKRSLVPHARWGLKYASDEIGKFIAAILNIDTKTTPASQVTPLINELVQTGKLGAQSIAGRRGRVTGTAKQLPPNQQNPQGRVVVNGKWERIPA